MSDQKNRRSINSANFGWELNFVYALFVIFAKLMMRRLSLLFYFGLILMNAAPAFTEDALPSMQEGAPLRVTKLDLGLLKKHVDQVVWSPDGASVAFFTQSDLLYELQEARTEYFSIYDVSKGSITRKFVVDYCCDAKASFSGNGAYVAIVYSKNEGTDIAIYSLSEGRQVRLIRSPYYSVTNVAFSEDGRSVSVLFSGQNSRLESFDTETGRIIFSVPFEVGRPPSTVLGNFLLYSARGQSIISTKTDGHGPMASIGFYDARTGQFSSSLVFRDVGFWKAVAISPDGKWVATGGLSKKIDAGEEVAPVVNDQIDIWNLATHSIEAVYPSAPGGVRSVVFNGGDAFTSCEIIDGYAQSHTRYDFKSRKLSTGAMTYNRVAALETNDGFGSKAECVVSPTGTQAFVAYDISIYLVDLAR